MARLNRRVHVLLDDDRLRRLQDRALAGGTSVAAVIRSAIDRELAHGPDPSVVAAVEAFLAAPPFPVGEPHELDREIEEMYDRGFE
jgi:hypothetical protein